MSKLKSSPPKGKSVFSLRLFVVTLTLIGGVFLFLREVQRVTFATTNLWTEEVNADCGIVLTGGANRLKESLGLLARGQIKKLVVSGVHPTAQLREIFPQWIFYGEIRENDVILERRSGTTYGNAQQTLPIVETMGCRDVVLMTSRFHMYRALRTFQKVYPTTMALYPLAVNASRAESTWYEIGTEVLKSLFYDLWAY